MAPLSLAAGNVHLWFLPRDEERLEALCDAGISLLSSDEQQRLGRTENAAARRFLLGRILIRRGLSSYLNVDPRDLAIVLGRQGKPALAGPTEDSLTFSLSHTRKDWVLAVSRGADIGVDLEELNRAATVRRIAERWFSPGEADRIAAHGNKAAHHALMLWTLKESVVKAVGRTMWDGLSGVRFEIGSGSITWRSTPPEGPESSWSAMVGCVGGELCLALAVKSRHLSPPPIAVSRHVLDGEPDVLPQFRLLHATSVSCRQRPGRSANTVPAINVGAAFR